MSLSNEWHRSFLLSGSSGSAPSAALLHGKRNLKCQFHSVSDKVGRVFLMPSYTRGLTFSNLRNHRDDRWFLLQVWAFWCRSFYAKFRLYNINNKKIPQITTIIPTICLNEAEGLKTHSWAQTRCTNYKIPRGVWNRRTQNTRERTQENQTGKTSLWLCQHGLKQQAAVYVVCMLFCAGKTSQNGGALLRFLSFPPPHTLLISGILQTCHRSDQTRQTTPILWQ